MEAGRAAGTMTILVLSGKSCAEDIKKWRVRPDHVFSNLLESVNWLLAKDKRKSRRAFRRKNEKGEGRP